MKRYAPTASIAGAPAMSTPPVRGIIRVVIAMQKLIRAQGPREGRCALIVETEAYDYKPGVFT